MNETVSILKDADAQRPIPSEWRGVLSAIVDAFKEADFSLKRGVPGVLPIPAHDARRMEDNIKDYGARLISLPEEAWRTSACQWMTRYWDVLVDLFTEDEGVSDLVLAVRVYEKDQKYVFDVQSVHVP